MWNKSVIVPGHQAVSHSGQTAEVQDHLTFRGSNLARLFPISLHCAPRDKHIYDMHYIMTVVEQCDIQDCEFVCESKGNNVLNLKI